MKFKVIFARDQIDERKTNVVARFLICLARIAKAYDEKPITHKRLNLLRDNNRNFVHLRQRLYIRRHRQIGKRFGLRNVQ